MKWHYRFIDGTKIRYVDEYPPFVNPELIKLLKRRHVAVFENASIDLLKWLAS